ncbi:MAG: nucleotidyltransferase domain-containing protein [Pseudomonadota bacterium]
MDRGHYLSSAQEFYDLHFADAACGFVAGSVMRGEGGQHSDIDLVVLYGDNFDDPRRESYSYKDIPIEVFIHNEQAQDYFFDMDRRRGVNAMPSMVCEGVIIGANTELAERRKSIARKVTAQGPAPLSDSEHKRARYVITDLCDDLRDPRSRGEVLGILSALYPALGDFYLRAQNRWSGNGKSLIKRLQETDSAFAAEYERVFDQAFQDKFDPLLQFTETTLAPFGGFHWAGDRQKASAEWRHFKKR